MSQNADGQIRYLSSHDVPTGLSNHTLFKNRLGIAMAFTARSDSTVVLLNLDLYNFKILSDWLGHSAGDSLLRIVTSHLKMRARYQAAVPARGDEFLIALATIPDTDLIDTIVSKLFELISKPVALDERVLTVISV
ncbi:diguanylate cyclase [Methylococcaceae bacterium WWC4]|nr:diguanylate cyclase [Methylococcaceae bacterium WWC4]